MDWQDTALAEMKYYCHSTRKRDKMRFCCLPFTTQIETILELFAYYSAMEFCVGDIKEFYKIMAIPKARSEGLRNPSPKQIAQALNRMKNVQHIGDDRYQILEANTLSYANELKYGYEKGYVQYFRSFYPSC